MTAPVAGGIIGPIVPVLHVVIPFFNEPGTLRPCVERVLAVELPDGWRIRLVLVDDHSDEEIGRAARSLADELVERSVDLVYEAHAVNRGKGAALQTGFDRVLAEADETADVAIVQDADLEYFPADYPALLAPLIAGRCDVVYGTRWGPHRQIEGAAARLHMLGNRALTVMSNMLTGYRLTDMECCYKLMRISVLNRVRPMLTEPRFGIEPQVTAALARLGVTIEEVPVRYDPRSVEAGKKIGWVDGLRAIYVMLREWRRRNVDATAAGHVDERGARDGQS